MVPRVPRVDAHRRAIAVAASAVALIAAAPRALAAPLAALTEDVDGDGAPDAIELGSDGVVHIGGAARGQVKLAPAIAQGRLAVSHYRGRHYVVAQITSGTPAVSEAVILRADGGAWHEVLRLALGGIGLDHDYGVAVDAVADGIYRYQTRSDIRRCDGKPAYLFAEKFDGARFRPASALPSNVPDTAALLVARLDGAPPRPPLLYQAHAASLQIGAGDAGGLLIPRELDDGRLDTLWREELAASTGEGQFFTFEPRAGQVRAAQLRVVPGNPASSAAMRSFNRPRRLAVVSAHEAWRVELPDAASEPLGAAFVVDLPRPVAGCVTVVLESTWGPPQGATAIAELEVYAEGERGGSGEALLAQVVAEGASGATTAAAALGKRGAAAVAAIDSELAATTDPAARRRLVGALARVADPAAAATLGHAATAGWVRDQDLIEVIGALGGLGQVQVLHDLAATRSLPTPVRAAAIAATPPTGAGFGLLTELDGALVTEDLATRTARPAPRGRAGLAPIGRLSRPDESEAADRAAPVLRRAVIERLSTAPAQALIAAAVPQTTAGVAGDLWRAATRSVRAAPGNRATVLAAMLDALPAAADYERRYRLVDGVASLGDAAALRALATQLGGLPAGPQTAALRQVAIRSLAATPGPDGAALVLAGAADPDPGVRLAALGALAGHGDAEPAEARDAADRALDSALTLPAPGAGALAGHRRRSRSRSRRARRRAERARPVPRGRRRGPARPDLGRWPGAARAAFARGARGHRPGRSGAGPVADRPVRAVARRGGPEHLRPRAGPERGRRDRPARPAGRCPGLARRARRRRVPRDRPGRGARARRARPGLPGRRQGPPRRARAIRRALGGRRQARRRPVRPVTRPCQPWRPRRLPRISELRARRETAARPAPSTVR